MAHVMVPQQAVDNPGKIISNVRRIDSQGGGIFVYTALAAAGKELMGAPQLNKHILLFSDAADSEEPGDYKKLIEKYVQAGITISVVGLGTEQDPDAEFLKDIAKRGNGSVYFTQDATQLTQFFTADTITYTRNSYVEDAAQWRFGPQPAPSHPNRSGAASHARVTTCCSQNPRRTLPSRPPTTTRRRFWLSGSEGWGA
jgi:hypothetical protein